MKVDVVQKTIPKPSERDDTLALVAGDFLTRPEFERRYHAHPEIKKAELIEGIVYIQSRVSAADHGDPHFDVIGWLGMYRVATPGVRGSDNATIRLDILNAPQPDALLRLEPFVGGRSWIDGDGYLQGAPEFVAEIAASSTSYDLHQKKAAYVRHGIQEYLVLQMNERITHWFTLRNGQYEPLLPDDNGIFRSQIFPGLWFDANAFWAGQMEAVMAVLQEGIASAEHQEFINQLARDA
ncbi:MAG: Uma2 family endonuclease [Caldilineaceae bacterium]